MLIDDKREDIIESADSLFAHYGIKKTTMNDLSRACGMGKSSLYYYFHNKDDILNEVIKRRSNYLKQRISNEISKADNPIGKIKNYIKTKIIFLEETSNYYSRLSDEFLDKYSIVERVREEFIKDEIKIIGNILEDGVKKGIFDIEDIATTTLFIVVGLKGLVYPLIMDHEKKYDIKDVGNTMIRILLRGIENR